MGMFRVRAAAFVGMALLAGMIGVLAAEVPPRPHAVPREASAPVPLFVDASAGDHPFRACWVVGYSARSREVAGAVEMHDARLSTGGEMPAYNRVRAHVLEDMLRRDLPVSDVAVLAVSRVGCEDERVGLD